MSEPKHDLDETLPSSGIRGAQPSGSPRPEDDSTLLRPSVPAAPEAGDLPALGGDLYERGEEVARGGMGRILLARDRRLGRVVAFKQLLQRTPELIKRFSREALLTARLQHPSIVPVYEAGTLPDGSPFYAMRLVSGRSLKAALDECPSLRERLFLLPHAIQAVEAVAYAHSQKVIHRDLKPANVLVGRFGETVVIDWGLAKDLGAADAESSLLAEPASAESFRGGETVSGSVMGSPAYMPPEQARGEPLDERADVYALGSLLYQLVAGESPYKGRTGWEVVQKVLAGPPDPLSSVEPDVPPDLAAIVERAMARAPADRYPSAAELAEDLRRFQAGEPVSARAETHSESARRRLGARSLAAAAAMVVLAGAAIAGLRLRAVGAARDEALASRDEARRLAARGLAEIGRQELLAGQPLRALPPLVEALELGDDDAATRTLLAQASKPVDALIRTFSGHSGPVVAVSFTSDGRQLVSAGRDGVANVWDVASGTVTATLRGHAVGQPLRGAWFDASARALTAAEDGSGAVWKLPGGEKLASLPGKSPLTAAAFALGGLVTAAGAKDGAIRVWGEDGGALYTLQAHEGAVLALSFTPDGRLLVSAGADGKARAFSAQDGSPVETADLRGPASWAAMAASGDRLTVAAGGGSRETALWSPGDPQPRVLVLGARQGTLSPDGKRVAVADPSGGVWVAHLDEEVEPREVGRLGEGATALAFTPDGEVLAAAGLDGVARLYDAARGGEIAALHGAAGALRALCFAPDGTVLVTAGDDGKVRGWRTATRRAVPIPVEGEASALAFSGDGELLLVGGLDGSVRGFETDDLSSALELRTGAVSALTFSPDGKHAAAVEADGLTVWSRADGSSNPRIRASLARAEFSRDSSRLVGAGLDGSATLWDPATRRPLASFRLGLKPLRTASLSADGSLVFAAGEERFAKAFSVDGGAVAATYQGQGEEVRWIAPDPDGERVVTAHADGTLRVWEARSGKPLVTLQDPAGDADRAEWSLDGERVLGWGSRPSVRIWHVQTGRLIAALEHPGKVLAVALSPDGERFATGCADGAARIWDVATGRLLVAHRGSGEPVRALGFSADGQLLGAVDGSFVRAWDVRLDQRALPELDALLRCVPYRVEEGLVVPAPASRTDCR